MIQGYFTIKPVKLSDEDQEFFDLKMGTLTVYYRLLKKGERYFYHAVIQDNANLPKLLDAISINEPEVLGVWNLDGTPFGVIRNIGTDGKITYSGEAKYLFEIDKVEKYLDDRVIYDENMEEINRVKKHYSFSGFQDPVDFKEA